MKLYFSFVIKKRVNNPPKLKRLGLGLILPPLVLFDAQMLKFETN